VLSLSDATVYCGSAIPVFWQRNKGVARQELKTE
jgi:hypothetical protein